MIMALTIREFDVCTSYDEWDRLHGLTGSRNARKSVHGERAYQVQMRSAHQKWPPPFRGKKGISLGLVARFFQFEVGHVRRCVVFFEYAIKISCLILCNASPES